VSDARALYKQGFGHFAKGEHAEAIRLYREAIDVQADLAIAWNGLSMALAQSGDLDGAIEAAKRLIELEPDDALSHTNLSRFYQQKGMIPEAEDEKAVAMRLQMRNQ
jgi:tetratricopeptide (TPR) repeat protein